MISASVFRATDKATRGRRIADLGASVLCGSWAFHIDPGTWDAKKVRGTGAAGIIDFQSNGQGDKRFDWNIAFQSNRQGDKVTGGQGECGLWILDCGMRISDLGAFVGRGR